MLGSTQLKTAHFLVKMDLFVMDLNEAAIPVLYLERASKSLVSTPDPDGCDKLL